MLNGKYRGRVSDNQDPLGRGRITALVPAISDSPLTWAEPCIPYAGPKVGWYVIPPVGANVWIEFEGGDPDYPIWTGCFWGTSSEVPKPASQGNPANPSIVLETVQQNMIVISDGSRSRSSRDTPRTRHATSSASSTTVRDPRRPPERPPPERPPPARRARSKR